MGIRESGCFKIVKDAFYFSHDSNAKDDPKCVMLIEQLGLEGYGIFWILIEMLRDQPGYKYPLALIPAIARRYNTTAEKVKAVIRGYDLFTVDENDFFSLSLMKRMEHLDYKRELARVAGKKSAEKRLLNSGSTDVQPTLNGGSTSKVKESKVKEIKVKEIKVNEIKLNYADSVLMTEIEYGKLNDEYGSDFTKKCIEVLDNYKGATGKTYKSDYKAILNWVVKRVQEETKKQPSNVSQMPRAFRTIMEVANE